MNLIVVDDERIALNGLMNTVHRVTPDALVQGFRDPGEALEHARTERVDVAFLDVRMRGMSGIELAHRLLDLQPRINLIFVTGYEEYMSEAFGLFASGYLMKPATEEDVREQLAHLRYPVPEESPRVRVQTFGNFEVFVDGQPVSFAYVKTKELLAYLIDRRGAQCSTQEIIANLWEDDDVERHASYLQNLRSDLLKTLKGLGCGEIIARQRGTMGVVPDLLECDYYQWLAGEHSVSTGEYMRQYSWGELSGPRRGNEMKG